MDTKKIRNIVVSITLLGIVIFVAFTFVNENPQRMEMKQRIRQLDSEIVQRRAISKDLERYQAEHQKLVATLNDQLQHLDPQLDTLAAKMTEIGVTMTRAPEVLIRRGKRFPFKLEGASREQLTSAIAVLSELGVFRDYTLFEVADGHWRVELAEITYDNREMSNPATEVVRETWYGSLNDDLRQEIEEKERQLAQLNELLGETRSFSSVKREIEESLELIDAYKGQQLLERIVPQLHLDLPACTGKIELIKLLELELKNCAGLGELEAFAKEVGLEILSKSDKGGVLRATLK